MAALADQLYPSLMAALDHWEGCRPAGVGQHPHWDPGLPRCLDGADHALDDSLLPAHCGARGAGRGSGGHGIQEGPMAAIAWERRCVGQWRGIANEVHPGAWGWPCQTNRGHTAPSA